MTRSSPRSSGAPPRWSRSLALLACLFTNAKHQLSRLFFSVYVPVDESKLVFLMLAC